MAKLATIRDLEDFAAATPDERLALAPLIAGLAGPDFRACGHLVGAKQWIAVEHAPSGLLFVVVAGGRFSMGLTARDVDRVRDCVDFSSGAIQARLVAIEESATPVHEVVVAPFLLSTTLATGAQIRALTAGATHNTEPTPGEALELIALLGDFRFPSEAELEYAAREGGALAFVGEGEVSWRQSRRWPRENGWGISDLTLGCWAADEWHPDYSGAPATSLPWTNGGVPGVYRGSLLYPPESEEELLFGLAAVRGRLASLDDEWPVAVRPARTLDV